MEEKQALTLEQRLANITTMGQQTAQQILETRDLLAQNRARVIQFEEDNIKPHEEALKALLLLKTKLEANAELIQTLMNEGKAGEPPAPPAPPVTPDELKQVIGATLIPPVRSKNKRTRK